MNNSCFNAVSYNREVSCDESAFSVSSNYFEVSQSPRGNQFNIKSQTVTSEVSGEVGTSRGVQEVAEPIISEISTGVEVAGVAQEVAEHIISEISTGIEVARVVQEVAAPVLQRLEAFAIKLEGRNRVSITSREEMLSQTEELIHQVHDGHKKVSFYLTADTPSTQEFLQKLGEGVDIKQERIQVELTPKKVSVEAYANGVIEHREKVESYGDSWGGWRTYPDSTKEEGQFSGFQFVAGRITKNGFTTYKIRYPLEVVIDRQRISIASEGEIVSKVRNQIGQGCGLIMFDYGYGIGNIEKQYIIGVLKEDFYVSATEGHGRAVIGPKFMEEEREDIILRTYTNGIVDEVRSWDKTAGEAIQQTWSGRRIYPDEKEEKGKFREGKLESGVCQESGNITYIQPMSVISSRSQKLSLVLGESGIVSLRQNTQNSEKHTLSDISPEETLIRILLLEQYVDKKNLEKIFSGYLSYPQIMDAMTAEQISSLPKSTLVTLVYMGKMRGYELQEEVINALLEKYATNTEVVDALQISSVDYRKKIAIEKIKDMISGLSVLREKTSSEIATEISELLPVAEWSSQQVLDHFFEEGNCFLALLEPALIDALSLLDPNPMNKIRLSILKDKNMTRTTLLQLLEENGLSQDEAFIATCSNLAYKIRNPYIYQPSAQVVSAEDYTVNFLWENLNPQNDQAQHIFGAGTDQPEMVDKVAAWAHTLPGAHMRIWYDSALVTERARANTLCLLAPVAEREGVNLTLRDIRQLPSVKAPGEIQNLLHPAVPVYVRVDLLKAVIADDLMGSEPEQYCVVTDVDVETMPVQHLFDDRTVKTLDSKGLVYNACGFGHFENSFFIFNPKHQGIRALHREDVLDKVSIRMAKIRVGGYYEYGKNYIDAQFVFNAYNQIRDCAAGKIVKAPSSQFDLGGHFSKTDHRSETCRFIGDSNIPVTCHGRSVPAGQDDDNQGRVIDSLRDWTPVPLV